MKGSSKMWFFSLLTPHPACSTHTYLLHQGHATKDMKRGTWGHQKEAVWAENREREDEAKSHSVGRKARRKRPWPGFRSADKLEREKKQQDWEGRRPWCRQLQWDTILRSSTQIYHHVLQYSRGSWLRGCISSLTHLTIYEIIRQNSIAFKDLLQLEWGLFIFYVPRDFCFLAFNT